MAKMKTGSTCNEEGDSIDIYAVLERFRRDWKDIDSYVEAIGAITEHLRAAEKTGYLGTLYRTDFVVEGKGPFPIDMLRYTCAWPADETGAKAIEDLFDNNTLHRTIVLSKYHRDPKPNLAADRWAAKFRWRVVRIVETVAV
jgi:hypothetical protein